MTPYFALMLSHFHKAVVFHGAETTAKAPTVQVIPPKELVDVCLDQMELQMMGISGVKA